MRELRISYEADKRNIWLERVIIFLLKAFGWQLWLKSWLHVQELGSTRILLFEKKDS